LPDRFFGRRPFGVFGSAVGELATEYPGGFRDVVIWCHVGMLILSVDDKLSMVAAVKI